MQTQANVATTRPAALQQWEEIEPGWWFTVARDGSEVHVQDDKGHGWSTMTMRHGDAVSLPSFNKDPEVIVAMALDTLNRHDRHLVA